MDAQRQRRWIEDSLRRSLSLALEDTSDNWYEAPLRRARAASTRAFREVFGRTIPRDVKRRIDERVEKMLRDVQRGEEQDPKVQARMVAAAIAAYVSAAVLDAGHEPGWVKEWVTVGDDKVRPSHRATAGQVVPADEPFDVGGHSMYGPGDVSAPIEEWANCRCHAVYRPAEEPQAIAAAADPGNFVIVALPAADDPIMGVSSEDPPHVTLLYLAAEGLDAAREVLAGVAQEFQPFEVGTLETGELGDQGAKVVHLIPGDLTQLRGALLGIEPLLRAWEAVEQHPEWTPHLTIGYPQTPPLSDTVPDTITFDRLAILTDGLDSEYPMGAAMTEQATEEIDLNGEYGWEPTPLYGVLAPEGVPTGDKRGFDADALVWGDYTKSLRWQPADAEGHGGSVVTARFTKIWRDAGLIKFEAEAVLSDPADEMVGLIAEGALGGVSVDLDDTTVEMRNSDGTDGMFAEPRIEVVDGEEVEVLGELDAEPTMWVTSGAIRSASVLPIPAFKEAFIAIGTWAEHDAQTDAPKDGEEPVLEPVDEAIAASAEFAVSEKPWDGSASRFTPEQWYRSCVLHRSTDAENKSDHSLPIREPDGALSRAAVHAAAGRLGQVDATPEQKATARRALRGAYRQLGEDAPESLTAAAQIADELMAFADLAPGVTEDGPGWLTHPVDTDRLRDYWVRGAGAAKIGWGAPGDFNRCRVLLAPYVKARYLAGYCANRHKDALGFWPGNHRGKHAAQVEPFTLVASGDDWRPPRSWFDNPNLGGPSALVVTEDGRVYGHVATWGTCHTAFRECVEPPSSPSGYAYFRTGIVITDEGEVAVGQLTVDTGHPDLTYGAMAAKAHYDDTGAQVADVAAGEDEYGIWVAGAVRPWATAEQIHKLRASRLSGDWRPIGGELEMIAALAVNSGGFPIPRAALAASGVQALVAAGVVVPQREVLARMVDDAVARELARRTYAGLRGAVLARQRAAVIERFRTIRDAHTEKE